MSDREMTLHETILGGGEEAYRIARMLEGLLMAQVALAMARFGVPDLLAAGPRPVGEIAPAVGAEPDALRRVLAAASVYQLVRRDDAGRYALTSTGELLRTDAERSARGLAGGFLGPAMWTVGSDIIEVLRGKRWTRARPAGSMSSTASIRTRPCGFARAMGRITGTMVGELAASGFAPVGSGRIVDVGGSRGTLLAYLLRADPASTGILFDRKEALGEAPEFLAGADVADRAELASESFLEEVPAGGDLYVLSQVLHNWDDERVRVIVGNCHRASRPAVTSW